MLEMLNQVILRGIVARVNKSNVAEKAHVQFTLVTNYAYRGNDGMPCMETLWINVSAWEGKGVNNTDALQKGAAVEVEGRLRAYKYTDGDGNERRSYEVVARTLKVVKDDSAEVNVPGEPRSV